MNRQLFAIMVTIMAIGIIPYMIFGIITNAHDFIKYVRENHKDKYDALIIHYYNGQSDCMGDYGDVVWLVDECDNSLSVCEISKDKYAIGYDALDIMGCEEMHQVDISDLQKRAKDFFGEYQVWCGSFTRDGICASSRYCT